MEKNSKDLMGVMFNGSVTFNGPMFDIHDNQHVHIAMSPHSGIQEEQPVPKIDNERLVRAIENCQQYFWGNSAYAVLFCVCRDRYGMVPNKTAFERQMEQLPYNKERTFKCPKGTLTNAFCDNPIYNSPIDKWEAMNGLGRIIKLRDKLLEQLEI